MRYEIFSPDRFIVGTVGEPGERAFYVQARKDKQIFSVAIEKDQVRAIVSRLEIIIAGIKRANPFELMGTIPIDDGALDSPVDSLFVTGAISISWDDQIKVVNFEFYDETEVLALSVSLAGAQSFVNRSKAVVNAGRLPCPFCSIPIDPRGHLCPRENGYKR